MLLNAIDNQTVDVYAISVYVEKWLKTVCHSLSVGLEVSGLKEILSTLVQYDLCQGKIVDALYRTLLNDSLQST